MCGISVIFSNEPNISLLDNIKFNEAIAHRGPNFSDVAFNTNNKYFFLSKLKEKEEIFTNIFMGHKRLTIIDKSTLANQPFIDQSGRYSICYNGEIYNYLELRKLLISRGINFTTNSDTEVLLNGYIEYGYDFFNKVNGMFAFVIYDIKKNELLAVRDRFGVKPLYYFFNNGKIYFFSEIKQILCLFNFKLNQTKIYGFLKFNIKDYDDETLLSDICQLKPGHFIYIKNNQFFPKQNCWYDANEKVLNFDYSTKLNFKELLSDSIEIRLRSDVDVGSQLSGGIDSSIVSKLAFQKNRKLKFFSAVSNQSYDNDHKHIDYFHKSNNTKGEKYNCDNIINEVFDDQPFFKMQDEPVSSFSYYLEYRLFKFIASSHPEIKVILNGHGPDELFGYKSDLNRYNLSTFNFKNYLSLKNNLYLIYIIKNKLKNKFSFKDSYFSEYFQHLGQMNFKNFLIGQFTKFNLPMQLHQTDKSSMLFGLEVRSPFLDYRIFELSMNLSENLFENNEPKNFLKKTFNDEIPSEIIKRKDKIGFDIPNKSNQILNNHCFNELKKDKKFIDFLKDYNFINIFEKNFTKINNPFLFKWFSLNQWLKFNSIIL